MAAFGWRKDRSVIEQLFAETYRFDFFQAVHLLEKLLPRAPAVGEGSGARPEPVRFRSSLMASFPASEIDRLALGEHPGEPPVMTVNFMGLAGAFGPLPPPLSEHILARARRGDTAARDFVDLFNHRLVSMMFRARTKHRPSLARGSPDTGNFARYLFSLVGMATAGLQDRMAVPDRALLHYAGLLAIAPRSLHGLERLLADYFGAPVTGLALEGRWLAIDPGERTRLSRGGRNNRLGADAVVGNRAWDQHAGLRLTFGPLPLQRFLAFLPDGDAFGRLSALVAFYLQAPVEAEYRLMLRADEVPPTRLGRQRTGAKLGWTSFLVTRPQTTPGEVRLRGKVAQATS